MTGRKAPHRPEAKADALLKEAKTLIRLNGNIPPAQATIKIKEAQAVQRIQQKATE